MKKIGIMGGTFDPIHIGHLILGEKAYEQFALDKVLFMPSGNPPHKPLRKGGATNTQRIEMVERAIASNPHFELSLEEMHAQGYIYTSKTLQRLRSAHPDHEYYFIMGADSLFSFDTWRDPQIICDNCVLVVAVRDHLADDVLERQIKATSHKYHARIVKLCTPNIDIASSMLRGWIAEGMSAKYYLPDAVNAYITEQRLYQSEEENAKV